MRRVASLVAVAAATAILPPGAGAQVPAEPVLQGRVLLQDSVLREGVVVLHHVATDSQGEVDSTTVSGDGAFSLRLPTVPDAGRSEVYFASVRHSGILYFGKAITMAVQLDSLYEIQAYDTTMAPVEGLPMTVQARNVFLEPGDGGRWRVTDLFQIRNDTDRTLVAREGGVVWRHPLPLEAEEPQVAEGDIASGGAEILEGELAVTAPLPPGERLFVVRYTLDGPYPSLAIRGRTELIEVMIQEPAPPIEVAGLEAASPVELREGVTFRRLLGTELQDQILRFEEGEERREPPVAWLAVILALTLAGAGVWAVQRGAPLRSRTPEAPRAPDRRAMVMEVARLDEAFAARPDPTPEERGAYEARRQALVRRLVQLG